MTRLLRTVAAAAMLGFPGAASVVRAQSTEPLSRPAAQAIAQVATARVGSIGGTVVDERERPLRGATVSALGAAIASAVTDTKGRFELDGLPTGAYLIRAHLTGFSLSQREIVEVRSSTRVGSRLQLRRVTEAGRVGRPVLAAGLIGAAQYEPAEPASETTESSTENGDDHGEIAWRLRHLSRSVLKDMTGQIIHTAETASPFHAHPGSFLNRAMESSARLAASLFNDFPFSGQFNLLTTGAFDRPQDLFSMDALPRGVAYVSIGAPAGRHDDWTVRGALTQGDVSSWILAGSYASHRPDVHAVDVGMSYSMQRYDGGNAAALAALSDGSRNVGAVHVFDSWKVSPKVSLDYGSRYAWHDYLQNAGSFSPRVGLTLAASSRTRVRAELSQQVLVPGAEEFLAPSAAGLWLPPQRTFAPLETSDRFRVERTRHVEVAVEREFGHAYVVGVRGFRQGVSDQTVTLFGLQHPDRPRSDLGHYYVARAGNVQAEGWGVTVARTMTKYLRGSVDYTVTSAHWSKPPDAAILALQVPSAIRGTEERFQDVTASIETNIPETATRLFVVYKVNTAFARPETVNLNPGLDVRFNVQMNQELPFLRFTNAQWEVVLAVRNLFRESLDEGSVFDELLVVRPPKRIVGGLLVRF